MAAAQGTTKNLQVARVLLQHTEQVLAQSGLPVVKVFTAQQKGRTFGERLANAFQDGFAAGYQRIICVGSDCPTLTVQDILKAANVLEGHDMVIGPAADGGAYLIGMHISSFNPEAFSMLNWQTSKVLDELKLYAFRLHACLNSFVLLQDKADIDSAADLTLALQQLPATHALRKKLLAILCKDTSRKHSFLHLLVKPFKLYLGQPLLRAPPL